jgi:fructokinase
VHAEPAKVIDTTGAGDAYAAGFLAALARGKGLDVCGRVGSQAAAEVISHYGARPQSDISGWL